jgi:hypothetical protein
MKTLNIKDLARTEELDRCSMAAVRGGMKSWPSVPQYTPSSSSIDVKQSLQQLQGVQNLTANGSAFIDCVTVDNHTDQFGQNNVSIGHPVAYAPA